MLKYLMSDYGISAICLLSIILCTYLDSIGYHWAYYASYVAIIYPLYVWASWTIRGFKRSFTKRK